MVMMMLTSWLFMLATLTCAMPNAVKPVTEVIVANDDCPSVTHHLDHNAAAKQTAQDCVLKPCPESLQKPALNIKLSKLDIPVFILYLLVLSTCVYRLGLVRVSPRWQNAIFANSIPLRYRFCVLLN